MRFFVMRFMIPLAIITVACTPPPGPASEADAPALLRRAVELRDSSFGDWRDACVVLTLRPSDEEEAKAPPQRIPADWVSNRRTTEARFGCETTLVYSQPYFERHPDGGGDFATVKVDRLCGQLCGDTGYIAFFRPDGSTDWQSQGFERTGAF
jgi:hypothetical protein